LKAAADRRPTDAVWLLGIYIALVASAYASVSGITTVYSLLSTLYRQFDSPVQIGWVVSSYYLVSAISAALCGRFGDLVGRRRMLLAILPVAASGAWISASSTTLNGVILGCAFQGVAGAVTPLIMGIAREALPEARVPFAIGVIMAALVAGGGMSFAIAGVVIDHFSWTGGFYLKIVLATIAFIVVLLFVPDRRALAGVPRKINIMAGLLFAPGIAGLFIAAQLARSRGGLHPTVIGTLVGALAILVFWARHQAHQELPLIDVRSLLTRQVALANLCFAFLCLGVMQNGQIVSLFVQQPIWTRTGFGLTATGSGAVMLALLSIALIAGPASGTMTARHGARRVELQGFALGAAAWLVNAVYHQSFWVFMAMCMLGSVSVSIGQTAAYNLVIEATPKERTSEAVGLSYVLLSIFMAFGSQTVTTLLATSRISDVSHGHGAGTFPSDAAYTLAFGFVSFMCFCGLMTARALPRCPPHVPITGARTYAQPT
jgi:MFS family permease